MRERLIIGEKRQNLDPLLVSEESRLESWWLKENDSFGLHTLLGKFYLTICSNT